MLISILYNLSLTKKKYRTVVRALYDMDHDCSKIAPSGIFANEGISLFI